MNVFGAAIREFYGWRVVAGAFFMAMFSWGTAFWGPPIFLGILTNKTGWSSSFVSIAVTVHFLTGAMIAANLPTINKRLGIPLAIRVAATVLALGTLAWAMAYAPWQLFVAAVLSGIGWGAMGAVAISEVVSPWFVVKRPAALSTALNGGTLAGLIFTPLWATTIGLVGFPTAAAIIAFVMLLTIWTLSATIFARTPQQMGLTPDGGVPAPVAKPLPSPLPKSLLWRNFRFITLASGMALGMFAQIGLFAHLYSLLMPAFGLWAGFAMGAMAGLAVGGRTVVTHAIQAGVDRRMAACVCYSLQISGCILFFTAQNNVFLMLLGIAMFGGVSGNSMSLPPLIAQTEFAPQNSRRVTALVVAIAQGTYAFAPATFGLIHTLPITATSIFLAAAIFQTLAIGAFLLGRKQPKPKGEEHVSISIRTVRKQYRRDSRRQEIQLSRHFVASTPLGWCDAGRRS